MSLSFARRAEHAERRERAARARDRQATAPSRNVGMRPRRAMSQRMKRHRQERERREWEDREVAYEGRCDNWAPVLDGSRPHDEMKCMAVRGAGSRRSRASPFCGWWQWCEVHGFPCLVRRAASVCPPPGQCDTSSRARAAGCGAPPWCVYLEMWPRGRDARSAGATGFASTTHA